MANGLVALKTEVCFNIRKLKQTTSAIIGGNMPDLLSVGYRCQELGFAFHWEPKSTPYFVLPNGKTEVDLHVDHYVPYLFDDGEIARFRSSDTRSRTSLYRFSIVGVRCVRLETAAFPRRDFFASDCFVG